MEQSHDQKWVIPILSIVFLLVIVWIGIPPATRWYDSIEDYQISTVSSEEVAGWIIQGRNDFFPVYFASSPEQGIDDIPALKTVVLDENFEKQLRSMPLNKKWIVITVDGTLPPPLAKILTQEWKRKILLLQGGVKEWKQKITAESIDSLTLDREERINVNHVRAFFHKGLDSAETLQRERYIAPPVFAPPLLKSNKTVREEGC